MIVLLECTCMISSFCILRWQCILGSINDANSNYLGNQQQTDQKIVAIGLKTPSELVSVPEGFGGLLQEIQLTTFLFLCRDCKSEKNDFCLGHNQCFVVLGFHLSSPSRCHIYHHNQPNCRGLHSYAKSWHSPFSQQYMWECGFMTGHFQFSPVLATVRKWLPPTEWAWKPVVRWWALVGFLLLLD